MREAAWRRSRLARDLLERCRLQPPVNRHQIMLIMHSDAVSCRDLDQLARKEGDAENDRRMDIIIHAAVFQDAFLPRSASS